LNGYGRGEHHADAFEQALPQCYADSRREPVAGEDRVGRWSRRATLSQRCLSGVDAIHCV